MVDHGGARASGRKLVYEAFLRRRREAEPDYPDAGRRGCGSHVLHLGDDRESQRVFSIRTARLRCIRWPWRCPINLHFSCHDTVLPAMSMFHANAWGFPYAATMTGSRQVFPGRNLQPEALLDLLESEQVTLTGGVPTIWLAVLNALDCHPGRWKLAPGLRVVVAGSAAPESMFRRFDKLGVRVIQPWGMTETTPLGHRLHSQAPHGTLDRR